MASAVRISSSRRDDARCPSTPVSQTTFVAQRTTLWGASFEEIAELVPGGLPPSAYVHAAWWSNNDSHPEAVAWLTAGWKPESVNLLLAL
jgi:hypothetical protein